MKFKRRRLFYLVILLTYSPVAFTQLEYTIFLNESDINRKSEMGLELWNQYLRSDLDSLKIASVELLLAASEEESDFARAVGTRMLGSYFFRSGKIDRGLQYMITAKEYFEKKEDYIVTSELYNEVGHALYLKGEYDEAISAYRRSIQIGKESTDRTAEYNGKIGMGKAYIAIGDTNAGVSLIHNYKQLAIQQGKYEAAADALAYLGMIEDERGDRDLSNAYYRLSYTYSKKSNSLIHLSHGYANLGIMMFNLNQLDSSLFYFEKSLELRRKLNNRKGIVEAYYNLGDYYFYSGKMDRAENNYLLSREVAMKNGFIRDEIDAISKLIEMYRAQSNHIKENEYKSQIELLREKLKEQEGIDDRVIESIDLDFDEKKVNESASSNLTFGWFEVTVTVLALSLLVFLISERKRIS